MLFWACAFRNDKFPTCGSSGEHGSFHMRKCLNFEPLSVCGGCQWENLSKHNLIVNPHLTSNTSNKSNSNSYCPNPKPLSVTGFSNYSSELVEVRTIGCCLSCGMFGQKTQNPPTPTPHSENILEGMLLTPEESWFQHERTWSMVQGVALSA